MTDFSGGPRDARVWPPPVREAPDSSIVLVACADDHYAIGLAVSLYSALVNLERGSSATIYILDGGIGSGCRKRLGRVLDVSGVQTQVNWVEATIDAMRDLKVHMWFNASVYLRLLIPDILPKHIKKAIYLDSDLLILGDLMRLWKMDLDEYPLLAVRDYGNPYVSSKDGIAKYAELGLSPDLPYFNSGVLVLNLEKWRAEGIAGKIFSYLHDYHEHVNYVDQDGLNAVLAGCWGQLDLSWNVARQAYILDQARATRRRKSDRELDWLAHLIGMRETLVRDPYIIHFTGRYKPWQLDFRHPAQEQWMGYLRQSRWFTRPEWVRWRSGGITRHRLRQLRNTFLARRASA